MYPRAQAGEKRYDNGKLAWRGKRWSSFLQNLEPKLYHGLTSGVILTCRRRFPPGAHVSDWLRPTLSSAWCLIVQQWTKPKWQTGTSRTTDCILTTDLSLAAFTMVSSEFANRPLKKLCLFDVDGTLTLARQVRVFFASHHVCTNHSAIEGISRDGWNSSCSAQKNDHWIRWRLWPCQDLRTTPSNRKCNR